MAVSLKHTTLTTESPTGAGGTVGATEWDADHDVPIASQAEAEAGTSADKLMTPQRTAQAIAALGGGGGGGDAYIRRPVFFGVPNGAALLAAGNVGISNTFTDTGSTATYSGVSGASAYQVRYTSAATAAARASTDLDVGNYIPPRDNRSGPALGISATLDFSDNYATGGARLAFGATRSASSALSADNGASGDNNAQGIWFSYSTTRGGNWRIVIRSDASNVTTVDTGVAWSAGVWQFSIDFLAATAEFNWRIRKVGTGTVTTGTVSNASNPFPVNVSTTYRMFAGIVTLSAAAKYFGVLRLGADHLEPVA